jgi:hypothetical protein
MDWIEIGTGVLRGIYGFQPVGVMHGSSISTALAQEANLVRGVRPWGLR